MSLPANISVKIKTILRSIRAWFRPKRLYGCKTHNRTFVDGFDYRFHEQLNSGDCVLEVFGDE